MPSSRTITIRYMWIRLLQQPLRSAALWAVGIVGAPDESNIFNRLSTLIEDPFDTDDVKIEAIKAVGNRKSVEGKAIFESASKFVDLNEARAIIHWSQDRISGSITPFSLPPQSWRAETSITDIPTN